MRVWSIFTALARALREEITGQVMLAGDMRDGGVGLALFVFG